MPAFMSVSMAQLSENIPTDVPPEALAHRVPLAPSLPPIIDSYQATQPMRIEVRYQTPYGECEWRSQWFPTLDEAERMVTFYRSCGSPSHIAPSSLAQFAHLA